MPRKSGCRPNPAAACHHLACGVAKRYVVDNWTAVVVKLQKHSTLHACTAFMLCA